MGGVQRWTPTALKGDMNHSGSRAFWGFWGWKGGVQGPGLDTGGCLDMGEKRERARATPEQI